MQGSKIIASVDNIGAAADTFSVIILSINVTLTFDKFPADQSVGQLYPTTATMPGDMSSARKLKT